MSRASSKRGRRLGQSGTASMEFALVAIVFFPIMFVTMDLGRYFLTWHSLRTVTSEAARAALVSCYRVTPCSLTAAQATAVKGTAPFLTPSSITLAVGEGGGGGVNTITVTGSYPFTWSLINLGPSPISETTLTY